VIGASVGSYRWRVCALLFFATTINYMDRQVLGILAPELEKSIGWSEAQYGYIITAFQASYAIFLLLGGGLMDRLGTRKGYSLAVMVWSAASMAHALARSALGFGLARFALGAGEAGNFPAAIKTVAEWFPKKERALAIGIFNSGTNVGAVIAPLVVPVIAIHFGWRWAFLSTGLLDLAWLACWLATYHRPEEQPRLSLAEFEYIRSDPAEPIARIPWARLFPYRQTWAFAAGKFLTDPIWWFYLYWLPKFLNQTHGLPLAKIGPPLVAIYLAADAGSVAGGWLSGSLLKRGWSLNRARKTAMLISACAVAPVFFASMTSHLWVIVALVGAAAAGHQGWSANLFATAGDMFPQQAVGSVVGIGGMMGAIGGMLLAAGAGLILQFTGSYVPMFVIASSAYLVALGVFQLAAPKLEPVRFAGDSACATSR
jgi:ACS family hexuronate transporter-like MFS transporter